MLPLSYSNNKAMAHFHHALPNERKSVQTQQRRLYVLFAFSMLLTGVLLVRLFYLQIIQFNRYETLSLKNQMTLIPIDPTRGIITDRHGTVLAENIPVYVLEITPEHVKNMPDTLMRLQQILPSIQEEDIETFKKLRAQNRAFMPVPLKLKLSQEDVATFAIHQYQFPGVSIKARLIRHYPQGELTAHTLGYVGRINVEELKQVDSTNYRATNFIGKIGIEKQYEHLLHGQVGYQLVETDVSGRVARTISKQNPVSGKNLQLSLDLPLQQAAYDAMRGERGAVVVINTRNGEVLAMLSTPSYDPNLFVQGISNSDYRKFSDTQERPLFNRAIRGLYPPASTLKPFVALAGLDAGVVDANYSVFDPGWFKLPGVSRGWRDWRRGGHGMVNLKRAITVSCDIYFYQLGNKLGVTALSDFLNQFGFGQLTHIDLPEEAAGILPSAPWKKRSKGQSWYPGDTISMAIGQGYMLASPIQLANATAALSEQGRRYRPHLLHAVYDNNTAEKTQKMPLEEYPVSVAHANDWKLIVDAMHNVTTSPEGTGLRFGRNPPYSVAAKTGTAQVFGGALYEKNRGQNVAEHLRDHSLFIAFTPIENTEIALAVMVENNHSASIVARKVLDAYYAHKAKRSSS